MNTEKLVFHESYGFLKENQLFAYKKYNVSPADHDLLVYKFGETNHNEITEFVVSKKGNFKVSDWW